MAAQEFPIAGNAAKIADWPLDLLGVARYGKAAEKRPIAFKMPGTQVARDGEKRLFTRMEHPREQMEVEPALGDVPPGRVARWDDAPTSDAGIPGELK